MLKYDHKGVIVSLNLDTAGFTGDEIANSKLAYVQSIKAGVVVNMDSDGFVQLCDGVADDPIGFVVNDAAGGAYENLPAMATRSVAVVPIGTGVVQSDQILAGLTIAPGDALFADTGADGQITNVAPTTPTSDRQLIGIAANAAVADDGDFVTILP